MTKSRSILLCRPTTARYTAFPLTKSRELQKKTIFRCQRNEVWSLGVLCKQLKEEADEQIPKNLPKCSQTCEMVFPPFIRQEVLKYFSGYKDVMTNKEIERRIQDEVKPKVWQEGKSRTLQHSLCHFFRMILVFSHNYMFYYYYCVNNSNQKSKLQFKGKILSNHNFFVIYTITKLTGAEQPNTNQQVDRQEKS